MKKALLGLLAASALSACLDGEGVDPLPAKGGRTSPAHTLGIASKELPEDSKEQALQALARDAFRRESRFLDAASPGYLFQATRVDQAEIDQGLWSADELFQLGAQTFQLTFTPEVGFGGKDSPRISRFHKGRRGGPDSRMCASCHWRGGPAGAGDAADNAYLDGDGDSQSSALARNPPSLAGAGWVELCAREMTEELGAERDQAITFAKEKGYGVDILLESKGVKFGKLSVGADGSLDTSKIEGIDPDLVVKPFGWKGTFASLRDAAEDALLVHHGMESDYLVSTAGAERIGSFGGLDPDGDGIAHEITEGQVTALTLFLAMQETPQEVPPVESNFVDLLALGLEKFTTLGCAVCHVPQLAIKSPVFRLDARDGSGSFTVDLAKEAASPRLQPAAQTGTFQLRLWSDLKRHDMGEGLAEPRADRGVPGNMFLTRPLWGVSRSRPYLHDAHAPTLDDAILRHGGEAQSARDTYFALLDSEKAPIRTLLTSLTRASRMTVP